MPSKSKKQHNFFQAILHSLSFSKKAGVSQDVAKEFIDADEKKETYDEYKYKGVRPYKK